MRYTVDRIEGKIAICENENGEMENIAVSELPENTGDGDVLSYDGSEWKKDEDAKQETAERIKNKMDSLWG